MAGLKFFMLDLLKNYRATATMAQEAGAEDARKANQKEVQLQSRRETRSKRRERLRKEQEKTRLLIEYNELKQTILQNVDDFNKFLEGSSDTPENRDSQILIHLAGKLSTLQGQYEVLTQSLKTQAAALGTDLPEEVGELKTEGLPGLVSAFKASITFAKSGIWTDIPIMVWEKNEDGEWDEVEYFLKCTSQIERPELDSLTGPPYMILQDSAGVYIYDFGKTVQHLRDFQREMTNAYNLDVAQKQNLQEKTQQEEAVKQSNKEREKKQNKQKRLVAAENEIEEQNARSKKIQEEIQGLNEVQKNQTEDIARVAEQDAEEEQTENDKLSENHVLLRHAEQAAKSFQSAKDIFKEIVKLTDVSVITQLGPLLKRIKELPPLPDTVDDETARAISKCRKIVRARDAKLRESGELGEDFSEDAKFLKRVKAYLETAWLPFLRIEHFDSTSVQLNRGRKSKQSSRISKNTDTWENEIWPLIKGDMTTSFEKTEWEEQLKNAKTPEAVDKLKKEFEEDKKTYYAGGNTGTWWTIRGSDNTLIAATNVDTSSEEEDDVQKGPELYVLKVHEDYESLGVGRYFSYKVQEALFNSDMARNDDKQALRDTMGTIVWEKVTGVVLTPSTRDEEKMYETWKDQDTASYELKFDAVSLRNADVRPAKHVGGEAAEAAEAGVAATVEEVQEDALQSAARVMHASVPAVAVDAFEEVQEEALQSATPVVCASVPFKPGAVVGADVPGALCGGCTGKAGAHLQTPRHCRVQLWHP